ncbi:MAG: hypothetical protein WAT74_03510 [Flavobacteriales bacterium]
MIFLLILILAFAVLLVAWLVHWVWWECTHDGAYEPRFYYDKAYWRIYGWLLASFIAALLILQACVWLE